MGKPWEVIVGDVRRVLRDMTEKQFDGCLSDLPYGISFMGSRWDYVVPSVNVFVELVRVLRPGAYAILFGGTKTFHRMMVNAEDGGLLPCDTLQWLYGQGFPKSLDVSKAVDKTLGAKRGAVVGHKQSGLDRGSGASVSFTGASGRDATGLIPITLPGTSDVRRWSGYGTALKPAFEPAMLACRPHEGTYAENVLRHGTGALAVDASRIGSDEPFVAPAGNDGATPASVAPVNVTGYAGKTVVGRWPSNVVLSHSDGCVLRGTRQIKGTIPTGPPRTGPSSSVARGKMAGGMVNGRGAGVEEVEDWECADDCPVGMIGGQARYFYTAKASRRERDRGLEGTAVPKRSDTRALRDGGRGNDVLNDHSCVKPLDLCRYFARLILPPPRADGRPRRIVVPYSGSGSEMIGCLQAGWDEVVGIELDPRHAEKARARIARGKIIQHSK